MKKKVTYRFLEPQEFPLLAEVFAEYGGTIPDPNLSAINAAIVDDKIVGFHVLQLIPHAEPIWIAKDYRGYVSWRTLQAGIESVFQGAGTYYSFSDRPEIEKLCKKAGMIEVPMKVWVKRLGE